MGIFSEIAAEARNGAAPPPDAPEPQARPAFAPAAETGPGTPPGPLPSARPYGCRNRLDAKPLERIRRFM